MIYKLSFRFLGAMLDRNINSPGERNGSMFTIICALIYFTLTSGEVELSAAPVSSK